MQWGYLATLPPALWNVRLTHSPDDGSSTSETSVNFYYTTTRRTDPEESHLQLNFCLSGKVLVIICCQSEDLWLHRPDYAWMNCTCVLIEYLLWYTYKLRCLSTICKHRTKYASRGRTGRPFVVRHYWCCLWRLQAVLDRFNLNR
jgi:hypothetical protein